MGYKSKTIKCIRCGNDEFFVDTLGIEHCSNRECYWPTMYITESTGRLSYRQIKLAEDLEKGRQNAA